MIDDVGEKREEVQTGWDLVLTSSAEAGGLQGTAGEDVGS